MKYTLLLILMTCALYYQVSGQSSCTQTLRSARSTYDQGRLHELPALLESCLRNGFTEQEKVEAYKLLTLAYIYLEEPTKADQSMLSLLNTDHYFEINETTDPAEFVALYKTFRTKPIYRIGAKIGAVASRPNVMEAVEANDGISEYTTKVGAQFHVVVEIPIKDNVTLNPELGFIQRSFGYKNSVSFTDTAFTTTAVEKQSWVSLPISIQYHFHKIKFKPYISLGIQGDYLLGSSFSGERTRQGYQFIEKKSFNLSTQREKLNVSLITSVGTHFKLGGGFVIAEARFLYGLTPINSASSAYNNNALAFEYGYAESIIKVNSFSLSVGYVYNIFNPKKIRNRK